MDDDNVTVTNLGTLNATGGGDVAFYGDVGAKADYSYTTAGGEDIIDVDLAGDAVDTVGTGMTISTGSAQDSVTVTMDEGVSQSTMEELGNLDIDTGGGADAVDLNAYGNFYIDAGAGNDFVRINSVGENGNANTGSWSFGAATGTAGNFASATDGRVLYDAELTVSFAGFEATADVETDDNFVATQTEINEAIKDAIENDDTLSQLLNVEYGTGDQQLIVTSNVGGDNNLAVDLFQPELVETDATEGEQVVLSSGNLTAIRQGLIDTSNLDSADLETVADVVNEQNTAYTDFDGSIDTGGNGNGDLTYNVDTRDANANNYQGFDNGGSSNSTLGVNFSTINPGDAHDVVVFHSQVNSSNTLEINQQFGEVDVVNFFDASPDQDPDVGLHALDFTHYLDNENDPSVDNDNHQSAEPINITFDDDNNAEANTVSMLDFNEDVHDDSITFDEITANNLLDQLNEGTVSNEYGGLYEDSLTAADFDGAELVGNTQKHIAMVENDKNPGEYKVFFLESSVDDDGNVENNGEFTSATELGTLDFGASINFQLAGNIGYEKTIESL